MEHFGYIMVITSMIVVLFIVTTVYWDSKMNRAYREFQRLLEVAEISHRAFVEGKLGQIERAIDDMRREIESVKIKGRSLEGLQEVPRAEQDSTRVREDRETMVVFGRKPGEDSSP